MIKHSVFLSKQKNWFVHYFLHTWSKLTTNIERKLILDNDDVQFNWMLISQDIDLDDESQQLLYETSNKKHS